MLYYKEYIEYFSFERERETAVQYQIKIINKIRQDNIR